MPKTIKIEQLTAIIEREGDGHVALWCRIERRFFEAD